MINNDSFDEPDLAALQASVDAHLTSLSEAIESVHAACWGAGDVPRAALPTDWYRQTTADLRACLRALDSTPTPQCVSCEGDYDRLL